MNKYKQLSKSEKAFIKTLPPEYGDNWEDDFRMEFEKNRHKKREYIPPLEELIDLNYRCEPDPVVSEFIRLAHLIEIDPSKKEDLRQFIEAGAQCKKK